MITLPDPNSLPRLRRENLSAQVDRIMSAGEAITEQEIQFQTYPGKRYQIQTSPDLTNWTTLPTIYEGDGTLQSAVFPTNEAPRKYFRMLELLPESTEPLTLTATVAWDGSFVLLQWNLFTSTPASPTAHWKIIRDGQPIGSVPISAVSFRDTAVSPGKHIYSVGFYN